jgi:hypothetical protein
VQTALEMFAPDWINSSDIHQNINHPSNAINFQLDVHKAFDDLLWGIEAVPGGNGVRLPYPFVLGCSGLLVLLN